jgi:hypothetical protein
LLIEAPDWGNPAGDAHVVRSSLRKRPAMPDDRFLGENPPRTPEGAELPPTETQQPDPLLQITTGRVHAGGITIAAVVVAVVVGVVLYGLNARTTLEPTAAPPSPTAAHQPAAGGAAGAATPGAPRANASGVKG